MATASADHPRLNQERRFFLGAAAALLTCTFAGFAQTYYLKPWTGAPALDSIVHLHGMVFTAWVLLFALQAGLISADRANIHVWTGTAGAGLAILLVVMGVVVALTRTQPPARAPFTREQFTIFPLIAIAMFTLFVILALANRHRPDWHKRFMLVATVNMAVPAFARLATLLPPLPGGALGGLIIANLFLAALALFDFRRMGRLHRATIWAGGLTLATEPLRWIIAWSDWWPPIAQSITFASAS